METVLRHKAEWLPWQLDGPLRMCRQDQEVEACRVNSQNQCSFWQLARPLRFEFQLPLSRMLLCWALLSAILWRNLHGVGFRLKPGP